jgi:hypothetical protein
VQSLRKFVAKLFRNEKFFLDGKRIEEIISGQEIAENKNAAARWSSGIGKA